jgi:micrococcal nuclease
MERHWIGSAALLVIAALLIVRPWEGAGEEAGPAAADAVVTRVVDGDTVEARIDGRVEDVRLIGIDTPETVKPGSPVECFGPQASRFAHGLLEGRRVRLVFGVERRDPYGRLLAYVYLGRVTGPPGENGGGPFAKGARQAGRRRRGDGTGGPRLANALLVHRGLARTLTIPPNDRYAPLLKRLELGAARAGRGLWGACPP